MTACLLKNEPTSLYVLQSKRYGVEAERKRVLTGEHMQYVQDPKPGELALGRVKLCESRVEARTGRSCKAFR